MPTSITTTHSNSQMMDTKSLDEESQVSMSPMLSRGKRNNSHFSNDLQLLIRDSYDGKRELYKRFISNLCSRSRGNSGAVHCGPSFSLSDGSPAPTAPVWDWQLGKHLTQQNLYCLGVCSGRWPGGGWSQDEKYLENVLLQIHASHAEPPPTYERLSPIGASVATSNLSLDKIYTADQLQIFYTVIYHCCFIYFTTQKYISHLIGIQKITKQCGFLAPPL